MNEQTDIVSELKEANRMYRLGTPIMSDSEYDNLCNQLDSNNSYLQEVEPEPLYKNQVKHSQRMLSTQKAKTDEDMFKWISSIEKCYKESDTNAAIIIKATQKLDGIAGVFEKGKLATRGDGLLGNDITVNINRGLKMNIPGYIKDGRTLGELIMIEDYFKSNLDKSYSHSRNFVSGTIMSDTPSIEANKAFGDEKIVFQAYSELPCVLEPLSSLKENFREVEKGVNAFGVYNTDGVIFEVVNKFIKDSMGGNDHHNHWMIALKPQDEVFVTTVKDIEWGTGRTGKVTPVLILKPVNIDGVMVSRCTAHNAGIVRDEKLKPGVNIEIIRSGSVIPKFVKVVN